MDDIIEVNGEKYKRIQEHRQNFSQGVWKPWENSPVIFAKHGPAIAILASSAVWNKEKPGFANGIIALFDKDLPKGWSYRIEEDSASISIHVVTTG